MNNFYVLTVTNNLQEQLQHLKNKFRPNEKIISQQAAKDENGKSVLIVTTEIVQSSKNLLLDQIRKGEYPDVFNVRKETLND